MRKVIVAIVLLMILPACLFAQGKVTKDPNLAEDKLETVLRTDSRLAQKVTYEARRKAVVDILSDLSKSTGITFYAGYNNNDWQVRDRKMNIFAKDVMLADLMSSIARVMKFKWSLSGEADKTTYRLYMDRKTLLDAEAQRAREEQKFNNEQGIKRSQVVSDAQKLADLPDDELQNLKTQNPYLYELSVTGVADALKVFLNEMPVDVQSMAPDSEIALDAASLSPSGRENLQRAIKKAANCYSRVNGKPMLTPDELTASEENAQLVIKSHFSLDESADIGNYLGFLGGVQFKLGNDVWSGAFLRDPSQQIAQVEGKALIRSLDGIDYQKAWDEEVAQVHDQVISDLGKIVAAAVGEPPVEHDDNPYLQTKAYLRLTKDWISREDFQKALADSFHVSIVSDSFEDEKISPGSRFTGKAELRQALDYITHDWRYNWWLRSQVVELRDRHWFRKRAAQIPDAWLENWRTAMKNAGFLDIDQLAQIAMLTREQLDVNITPDKDFGRSEISGTILLNDDLLRTYASMDNSQRAAIFSSSGLNLRSLSSDQWRQMEKLINISFLQNADAQLIMSAKKTAKDGLFTYNFLLTSSDGQQPIKRSFTTPKYQEPPKDQPKDDKTPKQN